VFCSFLALVLKAELEARIAVFGQKGSWLAIISDLNALTETEVEQDGKCFHAAIRALLPAWLCVPLASHCQRAVDRRRQIVNSEHVVPRRRRRADCRGRIWSAWICVCGSDPVNTG
jgi:hypothetical protein